MLINNNNSRNFLHYFLAGSFVSLFFLNFDLSAQARPLKISTWNLDWLTLRSSQDKELPPHIPHRSEKDFLRFQHYVNKLKSDIIAFQEVDNIDAAQHVFNPDIYTIVTTKEPIIQRVGVAIRQGIPFSINSELLDLDVSRPYAHFHLRTGLDITVRNGKNTLRILVVHLKTGCWARPLSETKHSCPTLYKQFHVIENWILDREDDGVPFVILGDFNRRLTLSDPIMTMLKTDAPLTLTTEGYASPCQGGKRFIDHILLGNNARHWLTPDSLRVMTYRDDTSTTGLSDHCPVSIKLNIP